MENEMNAEGIPKYNNDTPSPIGFMLSSEFIGAFPEFVMVEGQDYPDRCIPSTIIPAHDFARSISPSSKGPSRPTT